jgi:uncharacterized cupin superfamily protein
MDIEVSRPDDATLREKGVLSWPVWTCEPSTFDWSYDMRETCYIIEGSVTVDHDGGSVSFGPGDMVVFPRGLECVWKVHEPVRKHYRFD